MKGALTPQTLMAKAARACASAKLLLENGDADGACNRAYFAVFDAARAALLLANAPAPPETIRTHNGLIAAFGRRLVKNGPVSNELGRMLNRAAEIRSVADYSGELVEFADVGDMILRAERFVEAMRDLFMPKRPGDAGTPWQG